jgi:asparagine synthase (glutamine-hydrolysing)
MCGIAGIAAFRDARSPVREQIHAMCETIVHRGPNDEGIHVQGGVGLGMRRLSIIDLGGGRQPIWNEDRTVLTVFNGEIYNYRELRRDLEARGHRFTTHSDTEVIVHGYEEYGRDFPIHLNGMFAIALHDTVRRKLILVRDHIGIKPLYYSFTDARIVFGSEVKVLLASGLVKRDLDIDALGQFLSWEYVPGAETLLMGVERLEPGHLIEIDLSNPICAPRRYWDIPLPEADEAHVLSQRTFDEWADAVDAKLRESVQRQLVADVPLGAFLSGGVDSSLVAAAMQRARTFSIAFGEESYNEAPYARAVADHLGVDHVCEAISADVVGLFERLMYLLDDPIGDFSIFPTFLVSRVARKHVTVALSGDGGDELFGGYETYLAEERARQYARVPALLREKLIEPCVRGQRPRAAKKGLINKAKRFVEGFHHPEVLGHARWRLFVTEEMRAEIFTPEARQAMATPVTHHITELMRAAGPRQPLNRGLYVDVKSYLCDNILTKVDRMSMGVSLEARVPYLDRELVELAFQVPDHLKVSRGHTKVLLKAIAARHVPAHCVYRPKEGFSVPIKNWLRTQFRHLLESLICRERMEQGRVFAWPAIERLKTEHLDGRANHSHILWSLMVFEAWRERWLEGYLPAMENCAGMAAVG